MLKKVEKRQRGKILTQQGLAKLHHARSQQIIDKNFKRLTLEQLSELTKLSPNTLSKIFSGSVGVDKQTLQRCFSAFNLSLEKGDYYCLNDKNDTQIEQEIPLILTEQQIQQLIKYLQA